MIECPVIADDRRPAVPLPTLGVLGGMGAMATVDFLGKLVAATPARADQEHIPLIVRFCPEVPDRADALAGKGPSPEAALVAAASGLHAAGAQALAIPCNTAHYWYDALRAAVPIPILHIADAALAELQARGVDGPIGLLATSGTVHARVYPRRAPAVRWVEPSDEDLRRLVMPGIRAIKAQRLAEGQGLLTAAAQALVARGATAILMGCTEVPLALDPAAAAERAIGVPLLDATAALARGCVAWARAGTASAPARADATVQG